MKKHILRLIAVLIFASATVTGFSGCTVEYREHHHHMDHDHENHDHDYRNNR
ncbi:MAG TPA: hypothetical protein VHS53_17875 [Mucilaginibacter sp.]|nr:hypothetical protein [Mucilaginibacter sp.]HWD89788.1 hypothetical protein [Mucilaginibacter sp.]